MTKILKQLISTGEGKVLFSPLNDARAESLYEGEKKKTLTPTWHYT